MSELLAYFKQESDVQIFFWTNLTSGGTEIVKTDNLKTHVYIEYLLPERVSSFV